MRYRVELFRSDEGFAVSCPRLPGCWSQGENEAEALENIRVAIQEYLASQLPSIDADRLDHIYVEVFVENPPTARAEALARVQGVLASLSARDAQVLRALFQSEASEDDVARRFGIDREYLRVIVQRARDEFRRVDEVAPKSPTRDEQIAPAIREVEVPL